ncbi:kinase-like domain-containing protein [Mycena rebaudengoi]|nr:kinase-like domain-containing protein [Mycena rebaudengoi]
MTFRRFDYYRSHRFFNYIQNESAALLFTGDTPQEVWLFHRLRLYAKNHTPGNWSLYPDVWQYHMLDLDPMMWRRINRITRAEPICRRHDIAYDTKLRLAAIFCIFSLTEQTAIKEILEPLGFEHDVPFFAAAHNDYIPEPLQPAFRLALRPCDPRPATTATRLVLDRLECVYLAVKFPIAKNFATYVFSSILQLSDGFDYMRNKFREAAEIWMKWDTLTSLENYPLVVEELFQIIDQLTSVLWHQSPHQTAQIIFTHLSYDLSTLFAELMTMFNNSGAYKAFLRCRGAEAQHILDLVQDLLDYDFPASRPSLFKALIRLSRASGLHPRCFPLTGVQKVGQQVAAGGFGDIWQGLVRGQHVSVKVMRIFRKDDVEVAMKDFGREALIWRQLSHPNLLPFFGLYYWDERLCLVSPWMENGNILEFLRRTSASEAERISLILDISLGLKYLHQNHVVHGDLKAINILVTPSRRACITDFGLSSIADVVTLHFTHSTVSARAGTTRWQAPELLRGERPHHYGSDIYAFGCVCYEVLTGKAPFYEVQMDVAIILKVIGGERPSRPIPGSRALAEPILMNSLWTLVQDCWADNAGDRPLAAQIVNRLLASPIYARISKSSADWDESYTSKFRRSLRSMPLLPCINDIERRLYGKETAEACTRCRPPDNNLVTQNPDRLQERESTSNISHRKRVFREDKELGAEIGGSGLSNTKRIRLEPLVVHPTAPLLPNPAQLSKMTLLPRLITHNTQSPDGFPHTGDEEGTWSARGEWTQYLDVLGPE